MEKISSLENKPIDITQEFFSNFEMNYGSKNNFVALNQFKDNYVINYGFGPKLLFSKILKNDSYSIENISKLCNESGNSAKCITNIFDIDIKIKGIPLGYSNPKVILHELENVSAEIFLFRKNSKIVGTGSTINYKLWKVGQKDEKINCSSIVGKETVEEIEKIIKKISKILKCGKSKVLDLYEEEYMIRSIAVSSEFKRNGVGSDILKFLSSKLKNKKKIAFVEVYNLPMVKLFLKQKYSIEGMQWLQGDLYYKLSKYPKNTIKKIKNSIKDSDLRKKVFRSFVSNNFDFNLLEEILQNSNQVGNECVSFAITKLIDQVFPYNRIMIREYILNKAENGSSKYEFFE